MGEYDSTDLVISRSRFHPGGRETAALLPPIGGPGQRVSLMLALGPGRGRLFSKIEKES